ncbi:MAG: DnaJ domain-containing protein [Planctomycetes bacterium]|nr:DnaJ domain-containing protein [Planctomycetota bacterium]
MKMDNFDFMETMIFDLKARHAASQILEVREGVSQTELKKAYRRASLKYHPDHNQGDSDANKKFILVKCAYELLAEDKPCPALLEEINDWPGVPDDDKYRLDNQWGHFLWWRDKFLGSEKEKRSSVKCSSCI